MKYISQRGPMSIHRFALLLLILTLSLILSSALLGQSQSRTIAPNVSTGGASDTPSTTSETTTPKLEHFDPAAIDKNLNPCEDFYKYTCSKWLSANPVPPDQVFWGTGSGLELWNENLLRETLQAASANDAKRGAVQQKIGDYWSACMDESGIEAAALTPLKPDLDRIAALKS